MHRDARSGADPARQASAPCPAKATPSAASRVICAKSPARTRSLDTIQEPPTAATAGIARYSWRFFGPTPPVGTKRTPANGAVSAAIAEAAHYPWGLATLGHLGLIYLAVAIFLVGVVTAYLGMRSPVTKDRSTA